MTRLALERLVLSGFAPAPPPSSPADPPLLWPRGLPASAPASGAALALTDVRLVVADAGAFGALLDRLLAALPKDSGFWTVRAARGGGAGRRKRVARTRKWLRR